MTDQQQNGTNDQTEESSGPSSHAAESYGEPRDEYADVKVVGPHGYTRRYPTSRMEVQYGALLVYRRYFEPGPSGQVEIPSEVLVGVHPLPKVEDARSTLADDLIKEGSP